MITGKRSTDAMFNGGLNLHKFVSITLQHHVKDLIRPSTFHDDFEETIETTKDGSNEPTIGENVVEECLLSALKVGIACSVESPEARMSITYVVFELNSIRDTITSY